MQNTTDDEQMLQAMTQRSLNTMLDALGLPWVTLLLLAVMSSLIYTGPALWQTWTHSGPTLLTEGTGAGDGFVAGHDFVAFYSASQLVLAGEAVQVYDETALTRAQHELVGSSSVGYLAFMYPPTYLLMISPLSELPYFTSLAFWLLLPLAGLLYVLRRAGTVPFPMLLLVIAAPSVGQALFAGQNGLLFAMLLGGGFLLLGNRPIAAGILLGLATAKPQLAILIFPALLAGRQWAALAITASILLSAIGLATFLFGAGIWETYASIPAQTREWLAAGRLPWERMPTVYAAARMTGLGDAAATAVQAVAGVATLATVCWIWWRGSSPALLSAAVLAGAPLTTPFLYDYDLPFMVVALALYIKEANAKGWHAWDKPLLLIVWIQPVWWWTLSATLWHVSIAPLVYAAFFTAVVGRALATTGSRSRLQDKGAAIP